MFSAGAHKSCAGVRYFKHMSIVGVRGNLWAHCGVLHYVTRERGWHEAAPKERAEPQRVDAKARWRDGKARCLREAPGESPPTGRSAFQGGLHPPAAIAPKNERRDEQEVTNPARSMGTAHRGSRRRQSLGQGRPGTAARRARGTSPRALRVCLCARSPGRCGHRTTSNSMRSEFRSTPSLADTPTASPTSSLCRSSTPAIGRPPTPPKP